MQKINVMFDCDTVYVKVGNKQFSGGRDGIHESAILIQEVLKEVGYESEL